MYPIVLSKPDPEHPEKRIPKPTPRYLEFLTIFPDDSQDFQEFLTFLQSSPFGFERLYG
jgi:CRISPR-associated protein Cmr6